jgi:hypothetical protein
MTFNGGINGVLTLQCSAGVVLDGAVGRWQPGTGALKILSVLPELLESGMGVGQRQDGGEDSYRLHSVYVDASSDVWNE